METRAWAQTLPPRAQGPGSSVEGGGAWQGHGQSWLRPVCTCNGEAEVRLKFRGQISLQAAAEKLVLRPSVCGAGWAGWGLSENSGPAPWADLWAAATPSPASPVGRTVSLKCAFPSWTHGLHRNEWALTHLHPTAPVPSRGTQGAWAPRESRSQGSRVPRQADCKPQTGSYGAAGGQVARG